MRVAVLRCAECGLRFNLEYTRGVSFTGVRLGGARSMKCPRCRKRSTFALDSPGPEPGLIDYRDPIRLPLAALLLLLGAGIAVIAALSFTGHPVGEVLVVAGAMVLAMIAVSGLLLARSRLVELPAGIPSRA